jgi:ribose transport system substrate-binding protein
LAGSKKGAEEQAAKMNATIHFQGPAAETMIDKQLEMLDAAIALKPDAIGYAALGTTESVSHLKAAHAAGIPVYMFDTAASCDGGVPALGPNSRLRTWCCIYKQPCSRFTCGRHNG